MANYRVFLSHGSQDKHLVTTLILLAVKQAGAQAFLDEMPSRQCKARVEIPDGPYPSCGCEDRPWKEEFPMAASRVFETSRSQSFRTTW